ncbi:hypothetical protein [Nocardia fluminea]|uniref:hypothetical protein n=1 Tax=Nocardia fluminea TaxID=134984 RepID=UPI003D10B5E0
MDGGGQPDIEIRRRARREPHLREVIGSVRIGQPVDLGPQAQHGEGHFEMMQCGGAAHHEGAGQWVGRGDLPPEVGEQIDPAALDSPPPRLGVVY